MTALTTGLSSCPLLSFAVATDTHRRHCRSPRPTDASFFRAMKVSIAMLRDLVAQTDMSYLVKCNGPDDIDEDAKFKIMIRIADLSAEQATLIATIYDLTRANAETSIVQPWVEKWVSLLENQETCAICDLHVMVLKWLSTDYISFNTINDLLRTHMAVLDDAFAKAEEALEDEQPSYMERYELYHHYEDALTLLAADDTLSHILHDLIYIAPSIYDHVVEHEDDLRGDFPDWPWEDMV